MAALALAAYIGAGAQMDHYMAFSMVLSTACALLASPLPVVVTRRVAAGPDLATAARVCRQWAGRLRRRAFLLYGVCCPVLAWVFTPNRMDGFVELLALLLIGFPTALACAPLATEQALLQARGHPFKAMWSAALTSGSSLVAALLCGKVGGVYLAAMGLAIGPWLELLWLRRLNRSIDDTGASVPSEPFPVATMLTVLGASSGILVQSFYDQALLVQMGAGAQAVWGLATRAPSFLNMSLAGMAGVLCSATLVQAQVTGRLKTESARLCLLVSGLSLAVMTAMWFAAEPLTRLLYERGAFTPADTTRVAAVLRWTVLAYLTYPPTSVLIRALGLVGGGRTLVASSVLFLAVKVTVTSLLLAPLGVGALAVATLAAGLSQCGLLAWRLRRAQVLKSR
jgi:peptidoglycan biosynthesis protein MviN/MurJ (putative lipid II flippase)